MLKYLFCITLSCFPFLISAEEYRSDIHPSNGLGISGWTLEQVLSYGEKFLLQAVLPLIVVGVALYVGYHLLTASGDEEQMKKAFKALTYGSIGLIAIACAYAFVSIISTLSL